MTRAEIQKKKKKIANFRRKYFLKALGRQISHKMVTWGAVAIMALGGKASLSAQTPAQGSLQPTENNKDLLSKGASNLHISEDVLTKIDVKKIDEYLAKDDILKTAMDRINIDHRISEVADDIVVTAVDSTSQRIEQRLGKTNRQLLPEIRDDFEDALGWRGTDKSCLVSLMAAYKRALKSKGYPELADYLPKSLALCRAFIHDNKVKPFVHRIKNNPQAIETFIKENNISAGAIVFFPRQVLKSGVVNYHATSVEKTADGSIWFGETDTIKLQANNRVAKNRTIKSFSDYFRQRCPRRDVYIFNLRELVEYSLHQVCADKKTQADRLKYLYRQSQELQHDILQNIPVIPLFENTGSEDEIIAQVTKPLSKGKKTDLLMANVAIDMRRRNKGKTA